MTNLSVRFIVYRYSHHSPHSGYSRLAEYGTKHFGGETIVVDKPLSRHIIRQRMLWRLAKGTPGYNRAAMAAELRAGWNMLRDSDCIYHFLYGETTYHYAGYLNNRKQNRVIASFHQPLTGFRKAVQIDWHLRQLSAAICVGRSQQAFFEGILDPARVFFVPLGIDADYYVPPTSFETRSSDLCLIVGENYRDFPTLRGVIELVAYQRPQTKFVFITLPQSAERIGYHPNLTLRSGIPEPEFLKLYQSATLMLMPLIEATANNAILEGMACGLPLVVTDTGDIRDYVSPRGAALILPHDSQGMAEAVLNLLDKPQERQRMSEESRVQALKFSWPNVMEQLSSVYNAIA